MHDRAAAHTYLQQSMAFQPLYGQAANIFGRRHLMILSIVLFLVGSTICGGSRSIEMLIAGRAVQGAGGGPMAMLGHCSMYFPAFSTSRFGRI